MGKQCYSDVNGLMPLSCIGPVGEAKNLGPVSGPNRQRDLCTFCTINLDQEEVHRTKVIDKSHR